MEIQPLAFPQVHPFVRYVQELVVNPGDYPQLRKSFDCRLFYVSRNSGTLYFENEAIPLGLGDLVLWQPGIAYRMDSPAGSPMHFLAVNFDLTQAFSHLDYPIPPERSVAFDEGKILGRFHVADAPGLNAAVHLTGMQTVEETLWEMKREYQVKKIHYRERLGGLMQSVLAQVARRLASSAADSTASESKIDQIIAYIHAHYAEDLSNESLGSQFNYHPNYLNRQMVLFTDKSLHQYLLAYRITKAIELLETTALPVSEVGQAVGFKDFSHFSKLFKLKTGSSPSSFRRARA